MPDVTLSEALKEAYASAVNVVSIHTIELIHPSFTTPIRVVRDWVNLNATLESSAPVNPGEEVTFIAYAFEPEPPRLTDTDETVSFRITIDNISRELVQACEAAVQTMDAITLIWRVYIAGNTTGPQNDPPLQLIVRDIDADVFQMVLTATFDNLAGRRFPSETYTAERFPGMIR